jgi:cytoskeletal protein CcmA (bactofilin family)
MSDENLLPAPANNDLMIGKGVKFVGTIQAPNKAVINGSFSGELQANQVLIGSDGVVTGTTKANNVEVRGQANETVDCKNLLTVHSTGSIKGKVVYGSIDIQRGGRINGAMDQR